MAIENLVYSEAETIDVFTEDGDYYFTLDAIDNFQIQQEQELQEVLGRKGRKVRNIKKNKKVTISGDNSVVSTGLIQAQTGTNFNEEDVIIMWNDIIKATASHTAIPNYIPNGGTIVALYEQNGDGSLGTKYSLTTAETVGENEYKFAPGTSGSTGTFTLNSGVETDKKFVAMYKRKIHAPIHKNLSNEFSETCQLYINVLAEDDCGNTYRVQYYIPKADFSGDVTFEVGNGQTMHSFSAESLAFGCGADNRFWDQIIFGEDTADVTT